MSDTLPWIFPDELYLIIDTQGDGLVERVYKGAKGAMTQAAVLNMHFPGRYQVYKMEED